MRRLSPLLAPLAVTLFASFAAQPLFVSQLTCSDDGFFHIAKAVTLEQLIRDGHIFGRWSPHMAHGFGYPYFNYYGPLASYVLIALHALGLIYPVAFQVLLGLCIWMAGLGAYAFVREWWGEPAGVAAAAAYLTAPYLAFDVLYRGALAETFALAWPPLILWTLHRALTAEGPRRGLGFSLLAAACFAALIYTHNATALAVAPLALAYVALLAFLAPGSRARTLMHGVTILIAGLGLSARFWLPALWERGLVQSDRLLVPPIFTYYTNYLTGSELLAPPAAIDPLLVNPSPAKALGLTAAALAMVGFAAILCRALTATPASSPGRDVGPARAVPGPARPGRQDAAFALSAFVALLIYCLLTLPLSRPVWEAVPLMPFVQFPWRFLGPAALCAAILAGGGVYLLPGRPWLLAAGIALAAALGHLSWWYPRYCGQFVEVDLARTIQYEYDTFTLGTTAKGEFLPTTVRTVPDQDDIATAIIRGETPQYLTGLPAGSRVTVGGSDPLDYRATVTLPSAARLTFNQFYFPGWRASVNGQRLPVMRLTPDTGLMTVDLPAGASTLEFNFGNTPIRTAGDALSVLALAGGLGAWVAGRRDSSAQRRSPPPSTRPAAARMPPALLLLPLALLLGRPLIVDRTTNPLRRSPFDPATMRLQVGQPLGVDLDNGLAVLSTEFPAVVQSGSEFDVSIYLTPRDGVSRAFQPRFDVLSGDGLAWNSGKEALPPRWHKEPPDPQYWPVGQYAQWSRRERLRPGTPPGDYQLVATIFDRSTLAPANTLDADGSSLSPIVPLGTLHVSRPALPPAAADLGMQFAADHDFGPIRLLGYDLDRDEASPGDGVLLTLFLRAEEPMPALRFNLLDPPYPTSEWQPGDTWRLQTVARIPAAAAAGPYEFTLALISGGGPPFALRPIMVSALSRTFTAPPVYYPRDIRFGDQIYLVGYNLRATPEATMVDLVWHPAETPSADLIAFIHVEDEAGRIVAQSDAVPANWSRPTTGWLAGEYILDARALPALPPGQYLMYVGLADRTTGARLATAEGDRALLGVYKAP